MRGSTHLIMSLIISLPTYFFLHKLSTLVAWSNHLNVVPLGIMLGSLLPDLDASTSKIMHGWWRPFGLFDKIAFYRPLKRLLRYRKSKIDSGHRKILHSLIGCLLISSFFAIISLALYVLFAGALIIWFFWIGIPIGIILHLAEDSFTYSGVKWFYPNKKKISSTTLTSGAGEYLLLSYSFILFGSWTSFAYFMLPPSIITALIVLGVSVLFLLGLHKANPKISERGDRRYSTGDLVEFYIEDVGGKRIKPREPSGPILKLEYSGEQLKNPYMVQIFGPSIEHGLDRNNFSKVYSKLTTDLLKEGDIVEMRTYEGEKEKRVYFIVQDGIFIAYLKRYL